MVQFFTSIWTWIKNPNNRGIMKLIILTILIAIILMQCSQNNGLKSDLANQKAEVQRTQNNMEALKAPIIQGKINDSTWRAERLGLQLTMGELKKSYSDLLTGFEDFKKQTPKTIERFTVTNNEIIREIPIVNKIDSLGDGSFSFNDSTKFADGNSRTISGIIPFTSAFYKKKDSTQVDLNKDGLYTKIKPGDVNFILEQKMKLKVGLFEDPKTKKVTIAATTSYPGVSFSQLDGADIMSDDISRKAARNLRKTWGIGVTLGYGAGVDLKTNQVFF